ncbi:MAG TPA: hypothetical protein VGV91_06185 [Rubrobacter sp.]|nr:hypothetical protein [Rubrobacter sp.]
MGVAPVQPSCLGDLVDGQELVSETVLPTGTSCETIQVRLFR